MQQNGSWKKKIKIPIKWANFYILFNIKFLSAFLTYNQQIIITFFIDYVLIKK